MPLRLAMPVVDGWPSGAWLLWLAMPAAEPRAGWGVHPSLRSRPLARSSVSQRLRRWTPQWAPLQDERWCARRSRSSSSRWRRRRLRSSRVPSLGSPWGRVKSPRALYQGRWQYQRGVVPREGLAASARARRRRAEAEPGFGLHARPGGRFQCDGPRGLAQRARGHRQRGAGACGASARRDGEEAHLIVRCGRSAMAGRLSSSGRTRGSTRRGPWSRAGTPRAGW
jgi:hypothetical protein